MHDNARRRSSAARRQLLAAGAALLHVSVWPVMAVVRLVKRAIVLLPQIKKANAEAALIMERARTIQVNNIILVEKIKSEALRRIMLRKILKDI